MEALAPERERPRPEALQTSRPVSAATPLLTLRPKPGPPEAALAATTEAAVHAERDPGPQTRHHASRTHGPGRTAKRQQNLSFGRRGNPRVGRRHSEHRRRRIHFGH